LILKMSLYLCRSPRTQNSRNIKLFILIFSFSQFKILNLIYSIQLLLNNTLLQGIVFDHFISESIMNFALNGYHLIFILHLVNNIVMVVDKWVVSINAV